MDGYYDVVIQFVRLVCFNLGWKGLITLREDVHTLLSAPGAAVGNG
jgi:hypothetical protein